MTDSDLKQFAERIKDFKSLYLAGGIQNRVRADGWRQDLCKFFEKNGRKTNNPCADNELIFNSAIMGYKDDGTSNSLEELQDLDEMKEAVLLKQTEENDLYFISNSDLIIFYLDDSAGFGTYTEFRENFNVFKKPIIIVRTISRKKLPHWIKWRRYRALILDKTAIEFRTLTEVKEFFKKYFNFTE